MKLITYKEISTSTIASPTQKRPSVFTAVFVFDRSSLNLILWFKQRKVTGAEVAIASFFDKMLNTFNAKSKELCEKPIAEITRKNVKSMLESLQHWNKEDKYLE